MTARLPEMQAEPFDLVIRGQAVLTPEGTIPAEVDRKSTRLNSSHWE